MNRTLLNKVWAMLLNAELPESYWYDALEYTALLHNVVPTCALGDMTPEEAWSGNKPDVSRLHVFSSWAFVHIPDMHHDKLAAKLLLVATKSNRNWLEASPANRFRLLFVPMSSMHIPGACPKLQGLPSHPLPYVMLP